MPATAKYDPKRKKIVIEIDYDHRKNYPDNRPEGKSKALDGNGNSRKIEGAPDNVWYMAGLYEKKAKSGKAKPAEPSVSRTETIKKMIKPAAKKAAPKAAKPKAAKSATTEPGTEE
jgi:hypothetical protein